MPAKTDYILHSFVPSGEPVALKSSLISPLGPIPTNTHVSNGHSSNVHVGSHRVAETPSGSSGTLLAQFINAQKELEAYRSGKPVVVDGQTLSIPAVAATARYGAPAVVDNSSHIKERVAKSRQVIVSKVDAQTSIYGVSTGFGGSADTRTNDPIALGHALLQHQHTGVLPSNLTTPLPALPLLDPLSSTSMPESWVRGAILIRMNSLIRGHSGVRWELIEKMNDLLRENITPLVPLRGSISASGDLSPLSYIAGTLTGNPSIRVFDGPASFGARQIVSSTQALAAHHIEPIPLASKEQLGILNGTAFSASVAALALHDAVHLALLAQVCTAMGTEALLGAQGSFAPFIHEIARPHPGQVESSRKNKKSIVSDDMGELRPGSVPLTYRSPILGPQVEDILSALTTITIECNSTTDNPLVDGEKGEIHHGGNFQAMAVTNAMERTRVSLHHIGKLLFAQCTELMNPAMNRGLPPNLAATDPSHNYHTKGIDIHTAAYVGELGYLANPVSTHVQSAEMHNQAVNSLALISARATINSLEVLSLLMSSYLYALCQALDLRAMEAEFDVGHYNIVREQLSRFFGPHLTLPQLEQLLAIISRAIDRSLENTSTMDVGPRMKTVAASTTTPIVDFCSANPSLLPALVHIVEFRTEVAERMTSLMERLRREYLGGEKGPTPASPYLGKTRPVYEFVRVTLGVKMHGSENLNTFAAGPGVEEGTIGQSISLIHEAIRDGQMQHIVLGLFA